MKKLLFLLMLALIVNAATGQKAKRTTAFNYLRNDKLEKAMEYIEPTITHEKTMSDPKTWYYRGTIYLKIALSDDPEIRTLSPDALDIAYESYIKSKALDEKEEYLKDIDANMRVIAQEYYNRAVINYNEQNFEEAASDFERTYIISKDFGKIDTAAAFNVALASQIAENYEKAKEYYNTLIEMDYNKPDMYSAVAEIYKVEEDTAKALATIRKGREKYPRNFDLLIAETNIYLAAGDTKNALDNLEEAIEKDTTNPSIYFAVGANYDELGRFEKAKDAYKRAINLNPGYFDAYYNLGALYVNRAAEIQKEANDLPLEETEKYNEMKSKADSLLEESIPYLENALQLRPSDKPTMASLKEIYTRLNMKEKLEGINERLKK